MPHLPLAHHKTSKRDFLNETKVKEKQNKTVPDSNSNLTMSMTHHNQTKKLTTWFLNNILPQICRPQNGSRRVGEKNHLHTVRPNKAKSKQLILSKTYPTKVAINS
jgi:hypothetical protein